MNLNKAMIIGNLTRDPEARTTPAGQNVCSFGVATNRAWRDQKTNERKEQVEFHNIVAWGKLAQICSQYLKKGGKVYIEGRLQTRTWDDPTGIKKNRTEIVAENMIMLDRPGMPGANVVGETPAAAAPAPTPAPQAAPAEGEINVEDIPF